jgi:hypothetical protein
MKQVGRPRKHKSTVSKTCRLPPETIAKIEAHRNSNETFTDALIRLIDSIRKNGGE